MKISELTGRTGTSKETIHHYLREGLLRKPHKTRGNVANYNETHVETLLLIKTLRDHYYLPLPEIKKIIKERKKRSAFDLSSIEIQNRYLKPLERLFPQEITGKKTFCEVTGLREKWLEKMEEWGIIAPRMVDGEPVYSNDNVILGKLIIEFDKLGFNPKTGHDPQTLARMADFIKTELLEGQEENLAATFGEEPPTAEQFIRGSKFQEVMSLFIYYLYRRLSREGFERYMAKVQKKRRDASPQDASRDASLFSNKSK